MEEPLALALDIGTSSARALLWDAQGQEVGVVRAQVHYEMRTTPDGGVEMDAEDLVRYVGECLDALCLQAKPLLSRVCAVGVSTYWHSLLGVDALGNPLTPILSWADTRAAPFARQLREQTDEYALHRRTGCRLHPSYFPAKLLWLRATQPETYRRVARWISPSEYLLQRFFGERACRVSVSMASGTGLLNQETCEWDAETLNLLALSPEKLSPMADLSEGVRGLQPEFASRWSALREVPFFPAVGDGACGNVGSGCVSPERLAINLGTSGAIRVLWDARSHTVPTELQPSGLWRYRVDKTRPLMGAAFSDGGNVFLWMQKALRLPPAEELEALLSHIEPGAHGLTFLPFLAGERSMGWNPDSRASLLGMNLDTSPVEIVHAAMEAMALRFALATRQLCEVFPQAREIVASGGALGKSPTWAQMFADALGRPIALTEEPEASSRGAGLLALEAAGVLKAGELPDAKRGLLYTPNPKRHARYQELLERQEVIREQVMRLPASP